MSLLIVLTWGVQCLATGMSIPEWTFAMAITAQEIMNTSFQFLHI